MRTRYAVLIAVPLAFLLASCKPGPERLVGNWNGNITIPGIGANLPLVFAFQKSGDKLTGTLTSPNQSKAAIPMDTVTYKDGAVECQVNKIFGKFTGKLSEDGKQLVGTWSQGPVNLPLTLTK